MIFLIRNQVSGVIPILEDLRQWGFPTPTSGLSPFWVVSRNVDCEAWVSVDINLFQDPLYRYIGSGHEWPKHGLPEQLDTCLPDPLS